jgi:phage gp29-like protein
MSDLWEKANEVSTIGYKVHSAAMIVELVADRITDNAESGALWAATDLLQEYSERLELLASEIMKINQAQKEIKPKGKKK